MTGADGICHYAGTSPGGRRAAEYGRFGKESGRCCLFLFPYGTAAALESNRWRRRTEFPSFFGLYLVVHDLSGVAAILEGVRQAIESGKALPKTWYSLYARAQAGPVRAKAFDVSADIKNDVCA